MKGQLLARTKPQGKKYNNHKIFPVSIDRKEKPTKCFVMKEGKEVKSKLSLEKASSLHGSSPFPSRAAVRHVM